MNRPIYRVYFRRKAAWPADIPILLVGGKQELERILSRKTPIAVAWEKAKLHTCTSCGRRGPWDKGWSARGPWRAIDQGGAIDIACSSECREKIGTAEGLHWHWWEPLSSAERARRQEVGMSETDRSALTRARRTVPLPEPWKGAGWCRWCGEKIEHKRAKQMNWHPSCKRIWLLHYDRDVQAAFLVERDGNDCWDCRRGGRWVRVDLVLARFKWEAWPHCLPPSRREFGDDGRYSDNLAERKVDGVIVGLYTRVEYRRACGGLEVDHEIPLWRIWHLPDNERRPYYGPKNLRLRCQDCHKAKSKREAAERATERKAGPVNLDERTDVRRQASG